MIRIPAGAFRMGCASDLWFRCVPIRGEGGEKPRTVPVREVTFERDFAIGVFETTFDEFDRFRDATGRVPIAEGDDHGWGRGRRPVINVRAETAEAYAAWLSRETGHVYRLPSEAEWEYAARAGTQTLWSWGDDVGINRANCDGCGSRWDNDRSAPVGSFPPNAWGLHDMHGNVWELVWDCYHRDYRGAPPDGTPRLDARRLLLRRTASREGRCTERVVRGGGWLLQVPVTQSAARTNISSSVYTSFVGFRIAREIDARSTLESD